MDTTTADLQFYPTPRTLANRAFAKFKHRVRHLLEPSAGRGDLLAATGTQSGWLSHERRVPASAIDCIELDLANHPLLKAQGYRVVGHDFLKYEGATCFSHILMNPPFAAGAEHVLHAWDLLWSGELIAILNAETLRNPYTKARQSLVRLVAQFSASAPEYLQQAFLSPDTQRQTSVEIVLIHLEKVSTFKIDFIDGLAKDVRDQATASDFRPHNELMLPESWVSNQVLAFKMATQALRGAAIADVRATYYARRLGRRLGEPEAGDINDGSDPEATAAERINTGYLHLKEAAWTSVLRSTEVTSRLSSNAQKRLESEFKTIAELEFTVENVYGFIEGLVAKQGDIQLEMICDVFDAFSRFHSDNKVYYQGYTGQGWKSNSKHRAYGMALRASRIVLPACRRDWYSSYDRALSWDDVQRFRDFDKCFALLDSKNSDAVFGLEKLFAEQWQALLNGQRCRCDYFDARFYPKSGTFHIFPRDKKLVDRLNRLVGQHRRWLPPEGCATPPGFWEQFEQAEKVNKVTDFSGIDTWRLDYGDEQQQARAKEALAMALQTAAAKVGIDYDPDFLLEDHGQPVPQLPLLKAA